MKKKFIALGVITLSFFYVSHAVAEGVSFDRTRVIYAQKNKSQSITLYNDTDKLYLAQSSVVNALDETDSANFIVIPPLTRLEPRSRQSLKILFKDEQYLAKDRETLLFFSTSLIPESKRNNLDADDVAPQFNVITKMTIKFIYRPAEIVSDADTAGDKIQVEPSHGQLTLKNPTPHVLTLVNLRVDNEKYRDADSVVIAPFSEVSLKQGNAARQFSWQILNDYGATSALYSRPLE